MSKMKPDQVPDCWLKLVSEVIVSEDSYAINELLHEEIEADADKMILYPSHWMELSRIQGELLLLIDGQSNNHRKQKIELSL